MQKRMACLIGAALGACALVGFNFAKAEIAPTPATQPANATTQPTTQPIDAATQALIQQLGAEDFKQRDAATQKLRSLGKDATAALKIASNSDNPEIRTRALHLLKELEDKDKPPQVAASDPNLNGQVPFGPNGMIRIRGMAGGGGAVHMRIQGGVFINVNGGGAAIRNATININGNIYTLHTDSNGLKMTVTENGKTKEYAAKSPDDLKTKDPEGYKIYERMFGGNAMVGRPMILLAPATQPVGP